MRYSRQAALIVLFSLLLGSQSSLAQNAPSDLDVERYTGLHAAAHHGDLRRLDELLKSGADTEVRDSSGRTPVHVAAFGSHIPVIEKLAVAGADLDALDAQAYDIVTIAAVANDYPLLDRVLQLGASAGNVTSPYDGTALIAAAHLGHAAVVQRLIEAGAPLDHVNNLGWTALIEAIVLGDGGADHIATLSALVNAGADKNLADKRGVQPLTHARERGYHEMVKILEQSP